MTWTCVVQICSCLSMSRCYSASFLHKTTVWVVECDKFETFFIIHCVFKKNEGGLGKFMPKFVATKNRTWLIIIPFQDLSGKFFHSKAIAFFKFLSLYKCRKSLTIKTTLMSLNWVMMDQTMRKIYTTTQRRNSFNRCM